MDVRVEQRWSQRRAFFVEESRRFVPRGYEVASVEEITAKRFVEENHYSQTYPAARWRFGLFAPGGALVGVCVYSHPSNDRVLTSRFPGTAKDSTELGRLVLLDEVGFNAESWFVAHTFPTLRRAGLRGVVSFSDPFPRDDVHGRVVHRGHIGTTYKGLGARYTGLATPRTLHLLPDGSVFSDRAAQKVRGLERGWRYAAEQLARHGAPPCPVKPGEEHLPQAKRAAGAWLKTALSTLGRKRRHPGNLTYLWAFDEEARATLPPAQPYLSRAEVDAFMARRGSRISRKAA